MNRIKKLCAYLNKCESFADVACDHGYIARYMLKNGLCDNVIASDISEKCLHKAEIALSRYIAEGKCRTICCNGLEKIDCNTQLVTIAGIGGEEILQILKQSFIPLNFLFQPMKNADKLRQFLIDNNCRIDVDDLFTDGKKYYFIIKGGRGGKESYAPQEILYGRDSFKNAIFYDYLRGELQKKYNFLKASMSEESRINITKQINDIKEVLKGETHANI